MLGRWPAPSDCDQWEILLAWEVWDVTDGEEASPPLREWPLVLEPRATKPVPVS